MASSAYATGLLAVLLVLQTWNATSNILPPILSPFFDEVCKVAECGKGTCKPSQNSSFAFVCECDPGWKQARSDRDDGFKFLPCVIPNCTLNYSCKEGPSPVQEKEKRANESFFEPCHWADCGGGTCNKTSAFTHRCDCSEGYYNLLNVTAFPCFRECALGMDCSSLGINVMNKSTSSQAPSLGDNSSNQVISIRRGDFYWWIVTLMAVALGV